MLLRTVCNLKHELFIGNSPFNFFIPCLFNGTITMESETAVEWGITVSTIKEYKCSQKDFTAMFTPTTFIKPTIPTIQCPVL